MSFIKRSRQFFSARLGLKPAVSFPAEATDEEISCIQSCIPFSMASPARLWITIASTKYIVKNGIQGSFVECGVWRGGSSMAMARTLASLSDTDRKIYLFDTFDGMTEPTDFDRDNHGNTAKKQLENSKKERGDNIWCLSNLEDVQINLASTLYPADLIHYCIGDVGKTLLIERNLPQEIALLRLDTDWYESTRQELKVLFPLLVKGGVCLIDDYGHWQGARKAVDDYFAQHDIFPLMHVTDYTGRAFVKT